MARTVTMPVHTDPDINEYINLYAGLAMEEMRRTGVPASITLAQGIIESNYGRSRLAREANNHFGIKCHKEWTGKKIYHDDDRRNECFRKYREVSESYRDHSDFLAQGSRYDFLFELQRDDYKGWAKGLKKAGYATNPRYADMLINMINENGLHVYDEIVISGKKPVKEAVYADVEAVLPGRTGTEEIRKTGNGAETIIIGSAARIKVNNRIEYIIVQEGENFKSLEEEFELLGWELHRYNDLSDTAELYGGQMLYLQPKRSKADVGNDYHIVKEGETMYDISQKYGIKMRSLYEKNRMEPGYEPPAGTELWLRKTKPEGL